MGINGHCIAHMTTTHPSEMRAEMPSGMVPLRELENRSRSLHPGEDMHIPGYRWVPSNPTHSTHASAICEVRSTRSRAVGNKGHCIAHMASTHCSEVRAEMPSGMVPLRELPYRYNPLQPGGRIHGHTRAQPATLHPTHSTHASAICEVRSTGSRAVGNKGHCIPPMATTHDSEVRAEMPSGMVPLRELDFRYSSLHPGEHMNTPAHTSCDDHNWMCQ